MPKDFEEVSAKAGLVHRFVKSVQIDIMDGQLTPSRSWPYFEGQEESFEKVASGEVGLPHWKEIDYEADLMIVNPEESFTDWVNAGFHRIIIHIESTSKLRDILREWKGVVEIGVAINIDTDNSALTPFLDEESGNAVDFVQFMGIATIGFQGSPFDSRVVEKIVSLRQAYPQVIISVDGGVNLESAPSLIQAGANRLVAGSAIFGSESVEMTIEDFKKLATKTS